MKKSLSILYVTLCIFFSINSFADTNIRNFEYPFPGATLNNKYGGINKDGELINGGHPGVDFTSKKFYNIFSSSFGKITGVDDHNADNTKNVYYDYHDKPKCYNKNDLSNEDWSGYNYVYIKHLINNGKFVFLKYLHFEQNSVTDNLFINRYISKGQYIGREGASGCVTGKHLHFEIGKNQNPETYSSTGINNTYNPLYFIAYPHVYKNAIPLLRRNSEPASDFDVYGIANENIFGHLNLSGTFTESAIVVRNFFKRSDAEKAGTLTSATGKYLGGKKIGEIDNITGDYSYPEGDYMFLAYVADGTGARYGYPVKFSIVKKGDLIIDNDQKNADSNIANDLKNEPTYNGSIGEKIPGYFLTADLHPGRSNKSSQWKPYKSGNYQIYIHIPEYGPTATGVKYVIKKDGINSVISIPVNQSVDRENADEEWAKLTTQEGSDTFEFDDNGYVGLSLSDNPNTVNYDVDSKQLVAFDAVKFVRFEATEPLFPNNWYDPSSVSVKMDSEFLYFKFSFDNLSEIISFINANPYSGPTLQLGSAEIRLLGNSDNLRSAFDATRHGFLDQFPVIVGTNTLESKVSLAALTSEGVMVPGNATFMYYFYRDIDQENDIDQEEAWNFIRFAPIAIGTTYQELQILPSQPD